MTAPEQKEKLHKILDLILDINCFENEESIDDCKPKAMFEFEGHCNAVNVLIFAEGWSLEKKPDIQYVMHNVDKPFPGDKTLEEIITELETVKEALWQKYSETECTQCGKARVKEDMLQTAEGNICEECLGV